MGLDAYFYKVKKDDNTPVIDDFFKCISCDDELHDLFVKLNKLAIKNDYSFADLLKRAISDYINRNDYDDKDELMRFRNFHFLNDFFCYDDTWYAKDMPITKDQCITLRDMAKKCIDECDYKFYKLSCKCDVCYECDEIDELCKEHFHTDYKDYNLYNKIKTLYIGMCHLIDETDWDNETIVYNADW